MDTASGRVPRTNLKDSVAAYIREQIFSGELRPGTKVDQEQIAATLGVSKLPVREALISLESEALIRNLPRRGALIAQLTPDDVRDHYRIYGLLSAMAAERAAEQLTEADLDELDLLLTRMDAEPLSDSLEDLNFAFHRIINRAGGSNRLAAVLGSLADSIPTRFYEFTTGWSKLAAEHHRIILIALRARDAEAAGAAMAEHLTSSGDYAVRLLAESGFWDHSSEVDASSGEPAEAR